ncbi:UNVERIFIED_CONTAM: hypothetical protein ABIC26_002725 [Paenibacillus sp. PvR008]
MKYNENKSTGLKRMKEIAQKAMNKGDFTIDDVKKDLKKYRKANSEGIRTSKTQLAATPTLTGSDAQRLLDSLNIKTTDQSRINAKNLTEYFKQFEK